MAETIKLDCQCGWRIAVAADATGSKRRCPGCKRVVHAHVGLEEALAPTPLAPILAAVALCAAGFLGAVALALSL